MFMRQGSIAVITALSHESRDTSEFPLTEGIFLIVCCVPGHLNFQYLVGKVFSILVCVNLKCVSNGNTYFQDHMKQTFNGYPCFE